MNNKQEVINYFRSIINKKTQVKTCHRCGRLINYENIIINKKETLKRLNKPLKTLKWHKFKICESCFEDKMEKIQCQKVDLEQLESFNLTYAYLHRKI